MFVKKLFFLRHDGKQNLLLCGKKNVSGQFLQVKVEVNRKNWLCTVLAAWLKKGKSIEKKKRIAASGTYPSTFTVGKKVGDFICLTIVRCRIGMFASPLHKLLTIWTGGSWKALHFKKQTCFLLLSNKQDEH